jgi:hypothetical protein
MEGEMLKKLASWYIGKYWKKEYILREEIKSAILSARKDEAEKVRKKFDTKIKDMIRRKDIEKEISVAEVKAVNTQLRTEMDDMKLWIRGAEDVFFKTIQRSKDNSRIAQDMYMQAQKLLEMSASIHGAIDGIKTRALEHKDTIEKEDKEDRNKLRLDYEDG